jgi:hypothetical protein
MLEKEVVIYNLKKIPTGNLPNDNKIIAEALIYLIEHLVT